MNATSRPKSAAFIVDLNLLNTETASANITNESPSAYKPGYLQARFSAYRAEKQQQLLNLRRADFVSKPHIDSSNTDIVHLPTKLSRASPLKANTGSTPSVSDSRAQIPITSNAQSETVSNDESSKNRCSSNVVSVDCASNVVSSDSVTKSTQEIEFHPPNPQESSSSALPSHSISDIPITQGDQKVEIAPVSLSISVIADNSISSSSTPAPTSSLERACNSAPAIVSLESQIRSLSMANAERGTLLRRAFVERALTYRGVPYARKYWAPHEPEFYAPLFLDCCGLVRRVLRDLSLLFHFVVGAL